MDQLGSYDELLSRSVSFAHLLEDINQHQQEKKQDQESSSSSGVVMSRQLSKVGSMSSEKDLLATTVGGGIGEGEEDTSSLPMNVETKQEGTVKWSVYVMYLRAGIGVVVGMALLVTLFVTQQAMSLYSNWWLAGWSNDESDRHQNYMNCTKPVGEETNRLRLMSVPEWNIYRTQRFFTFCGMYMRKHVGRVHSIAIDRYCCWSVSRHSSPSNGHRIHLSQCWSNPARQVTCAMAAGRSR